ncbi:MAG: hypothetical protein ACEROO_08160, partial [Candidatus Bathyarchaeota archaeon]
GLVLAQNEIPDLDKALKKEDPEHEAILAKAKLFMEQYNAKNAKGIAELFTSDANVLERDGSQISGRESIEKAFADIFVQNPKAKIFDWESTAEPCGICISNVSNFKELYKKIHNTIIFKK